MYILYVVAYYLLMPGVILPFVWYIHQEKVTLDTYEKKRKATKKYGEKDADSREALVKKIKRFEIVFLIAVMILLPSLHLTTSMYCDNEIHRELYGGTGVKGPAYAYQDPVLFSLGPSYNIDKVESKMKEKPDIWHYEQIEEAIDLDDLTRYPGSLAVYRLLRQRVIVTYTYLSPYPIIKTYGFVVKQVDGEELFILMKKDTIIFPENPSKAGKILLE